MKDIRIFVASSKELERERNYLAYLTLAYEDVFEKRGFRVRLSKWEYVDPKMTEARTEDRYLDGDDWAKLLRNQPQFADKCDWLKLSDKNWDDLLESQPQFADRRMKKDKITYTK